MQSREERSKQYFDTDIIGAAGYTADDTEEIFDRVSCRREGFSLLRVWYPSGTRLRLYNRKSVCVFAGFHGFAATNGRRQHAAGGAS